MSRRQISDEEKAAVLERQGRHCFIDNHPISEDESIEFDHIWPYSAGGQSEVANIGAVCRRHNREKRALSLGQFRDRKELQRFFESDGKRRLNDVLASRLGQQAFGQPLSQEITADGRTIRLWFDEVGQIDLPLATCPATGERYFYAVLPSYLVANDPDLQPRALEMSRLEGLISHLRTRTQLAPSVARLEGDKVLIFDGQHEAAAQVWAGRKLLDCKVYLSPDLYRLKETNISAHDKLRQMPFYTSVLVEKYADLIAEDWQQFLEESARKTESTFVEYLRRQQNLSLAEARKRLRARVMQTILEREDLAISEFIAERTRGKAKAPMTLSRFEKSFVTAFLAPVPQDDEFETDADKRAVEADNFVWLTNEMVKRSLEGHWDPERHDADHRKADRLYLAGSVRAWTAFTHDAIAPALGIFDEDERTRLLYRVIPEQQKQAIREILDRVFRHKVWVEDSSDLAELSYDNVNRAKEIFKERGFTVAYLLNADE